MKITNRFTDALIFEAAEQESTKETVLLAIKSGAYLRGADLSSADLSSADLSGADLSSADLRSAYLSGAKGIYQFGPMPTSGRICVAVWHTDHWMIKAGCFWATLDELEEKVKDSHNCPVYLANIQLLRNYKI